VPFGRRAALPQERSQLAKEYKESGNKLFGNKQYEQAVELYTKAIEVSPIEDTVELAVFFSNRAACYHNLVTPGPCITRRAPDAGN